MTCLCVVDIYRRRIGLKDYLCHFSPLSIDGCNVLCIRIVICLYVSNTLLV